MLASGLREDGECPPTEDFAGDLFSDMGIELAHIPLGGGREFNAVGQGSVSDFAHQVPERDWRAPARGGGEGMKVGGGRVLLSPLFPPPGRGGGFFSPGSARAAPAL